MTIATRVISRFGELEDVSDTPAANGQGYLYNAITHLLEPVTLVSTIDPRLTDERIPINGSVTDAKINAGAAISYSKLSLAGAIQLTDLAFTPITTLTPVGGDLAGSYPNPSVAAGAITNAKIAAAANIAYSKLLLTGAIQLADLAFNPVTDVTAAGGVLAGTFPNPTLAQDRVRIAGDTMTGALLAPRAQLQQVGVNSPLDLRYADGSALLTIDPTYGHMTLRADPVSTGGGTNPTQFNVVAKTGAKIGSAYRTAQINLCDVNQGGTPIWGYGLDVGEKTRNGLPVQSLDLSPWYHRWPDDPTKNADPWYLLHEAYPRMGVWTNSPGANLHVNVAPADSATKVPLYVENGNDYWVTRWRGPNGIDNSGKFIAGMWSNGTMTIGSGNTPTYGSLDLYPLATNKIGLALKPITGLAAGGGRLAVAYQEDGNFGTVIRGDATMLLTGTVAGSTGVTSNSRLNLNTVITDEDSDYSGIVLAPSYALTVDRAARTYRSLYSQTLGPAGTSTLSALGGIRSETTHRGTRVTGTTQITTVRGFHGIVTDLVGASGDIVTAIGTTGEIIHAGTSTIANAYGLSGIITQNLNAGPMNLMVAVRGAISQQNTAGAVANGIAVQAASPSVAAGATLTTATGVQINNQGLAGVGTAYGLYINPVQGATTNWAIYSLGGAVQLSGTIDSATGTDVPSARYMLLSHTIRDVGASTMSEVESNVLYKPTNDLAKTINGIYSILSTDSTLAASLTGSMFALRSQTGHRGSGTVTNMYGLDSLVYNIGSAGTYGIITNAYGVRARIQADGGSVGTSYALYASNQAGAGTVTTAQYGLYVEGQTKAPAGSTYGAYIASGSSYGVYVAGGESWFNTAVATNKGIVIKGAASQSANMFEVRDSADTISAKFTVAGRLGIGLGTSSANAPIHVRVSTDGATGGGIYVVPTVFNGGTAASIAAYQSGVAAQGLDLEARSTSDNSLKSVVKIRGDGSVSIGLTGGKFGVLGAAAAVQQTGGVATAGAAYGATEQTMIQKAYDALRTFGFLS